MSAPRFARVDENGRATFTSEEPGLRVKRIELRGAGRIAGVFFGVDVAAWDEHAWQFLSPDLNTGVTCTVQVKGADETSHVYFEVEREECDPARLDWEKVGAWFAQARAAYNRGDDSGSAENLRCVARALREVPS